MIHIDEGRLQALADSELTPEERRGVEQHLAGCVSCRAELAELRMAAAEFADAVSLLERPPVQAREYGVGWPHRRGIRSGGWRALPRAAVLVLGFAAAASATLPGSPVRRWVGALLEPEERMASTAAAPRSAPAAAPAVAATYEAGVSVPPLDGEVRVVLREASAELRIRALLTDGARAGVYAGGAAASARFRTGPGRIEVDGAGEGELRIELPRGARSATVTVNGEEYLRKDGDRLQLAVGAEHRTATEVNFRVRP